MNHLSPPPPPYSETDIYSRSGAESSGHPLLTRTVSQADTASTSNRAVSEDAVSSTDIDASPVLTPPYTPNGSIHQNSFHSISAGPEILSSSGSAAYFESRPVLRRNSNTTILSHTIIVKENSQPDDLPYPQPQDVWLERDVLPQDWQTFVNYLIPHHADIINSDVADRKLKAEIVDERMSRLTLDQDARGMLNIDHVEAQLEPMRKSNVYHSGYADIITVVHEWNDNFFSPRGLQVELAQGANDDGLANSMPGSWAKDFDEPSTSERPSGDRPGGRGFGRRGWVRAGDDGFHLGRGFLSADNDGFRMFSNGLTANNDGFKIGNFLVANNEGFKCGPIRANAEGFHVGGFGFGSGRQRGRGHNPEFDHGQFHRGRSDDRHLDGNRQHHTHHRSRSASSSSSSSSDSDSVESVGSLPDYDKLNDAQLPIAKQSIQNWLNNPEHPITKEDVKNIRQEIKAARPRSNKSETDDLAVLRMELKGMMKSFKNIVRTQKQARREEKRKRRNEKREKKRERRALRREHRREKQEQKKEAKKLWKGKGKQFERSVPEFSIPSMHPPSGFPLPKAMSIPRDMPPFLQHAKLTRAFTGPQGHPMGPEYLQGRGWPFMGNSQPNYDMSTAADLEAEGRRIEVEARLRQVRLHTEEVHQKAQKTANQHRRQAEITTAVSRQKAEAQRLQTESKRMHVEVARMRTHAKSLSENDSLELTQVADRLEEESEKTRREGERLWAEAIQLGEDMQHELSCSHEEAGQQESGVIHN